MDGISTFRIAVKRLSESTIFAIAAAGLELDDIDLFVYHQANSRIIKAVGERLELDSGEGRRLHRAAREHVRRVDPAHALA